MENKVFVDSISRRLCE